MWESQLRPGVVLAEKYRIDRPLGSGGMAVVLAATHLQLREPVAIKVLHPEVLSRPGAIDRFLREARVAMRLRSEHVARVFDISTTDEGCPFIVMELLAGADLAVLLHEQGPLRLAEAADYVLQACEALAEAHANGVVHRDLKPANLFLSTTVDGSPCVKVLDFGVSKLHLEEDPATNPLATTAASSEPAIEAARPVEDAERRLEDLESSAPATVTVTRAFLGSPVYMAPEQVQSARDVDARADIWALGVILYELVSGTRPFRGATLDALCTQIREHHPAQLVTPHGPLPELAPVLAGCFAKEPGDRYQSVRAFAEAVAPLGSAEGRASFERIVRITSPKAAPRAPRAVSVTSEPTLGSGDVARSASGVSSGRAIAGDGAKVRRARLIMAGAVAALVGLGATGAVVLRGRVSANREAVVLATPRCVSNRACTEANGGAAARCREDGKCVALASEDCVVHAGIEAIRSDDTVWLGAMLPLKGPTFGEADLHALDLARVDFDQMMAGFSESRGRAYVRPLGLVACDDTRDAKRAARHLVENVRAPAIVGFSSAAELIDVGSALLVPNDVLAVASLTTSPLATTLPTASGHARLAWRTTYSSLESAKAMGHVVPDLLEPALRALPGAVAPGAPLRVAFLRMKSRGGTTFDSYLFDALRFNGRTALANGSNYREIVVDESDAANLETEMTRAATEADAFAPHVAIVIADHTVQLLDALERRWSHRAYQPRYLFMTTLSTGLLDWIGTSASRRGRCFGIAPVSATSVNARFVLHYNEAQPVKVTPTLAPNSSYDAFYLLAYAAYAVGTGPVTGESLSRAIARLLPPGTPIDVGPGQIFGAVTALRAGENIDLAGALGSLDFDVASGEAPVDQAVLCASVDAQGRAAESVESGVVFRSIRNALEGVLRCP